MFLVHHHYPIWCRLHWQEQKESKEVERSQEIKGDISCHLPLTSLVHSLLSLLGLLFHMEFQRNETKNMWLELSDKLDWRITGFLLQKTIRSVQLRSKPNTLETAIAVWQWNVKSIKGSSHDKFFKTIILHIICFHASLYYQLELQ